MAYKYGAYHTNSTNYTHRNVHHNNKQCPHGKEIKPEHLIENDDGGKPLCDWCKSH
jgi:hypothetical protein